MIRKLLIAVAGWLALAGASPAAECAFSISRYVIPAFSGGSVCKLRENGGNTTADFKLNASNALVKADDDTPLATWLTANSATNAFLHTWFDQTGTGNHVTQTTTTKQPRVDVTGVNNHPSLKFDGTDDYLDWGSDWLSLNSLTIIASGVPGSLDADKRIIGCNTTNVLRFGTSGTATGWYMGRVNTTSVESVDPVTPWARVFSARHGSNAATVFTDLGTIGSFGSQTATGAISDINIGADLNGTANFWSGYVSEVIGYTSAITDGARVIDVHNLAGVVGARQVTVTDLVTLATAGDSLHNADLDNNGLQDMLSILESGVANWYEQTSPGAFTPHAIRASTISSAKVEGCLWYAINGVYHAFALDQNLDQIRIYAPAAGPDYAGTWTQGTIASALPNLQRGYVTTIGGVEGILFAYEGDAATDDGGISFLVYDGSGDPTSSANWTVTNLITHKGAWALAERKDLAGNARGDIMFTARNADAGHNAENVPGVYWIEEPSSSPLTNIPWTEHTIQSAAADYLNLCFGDFFGNSNDDLCVVTLSTTNGIRLYDSASGWGSAISPTTLTEGGGGQLWNVANPDYQINSRDAFFTMTDGRFALWQWTGSAWLRANRTASNNGKSDNYVGKFDVDGDGDQDFVGSDSQRNRISSWDYSIPADGSLIDPIITSNGGGGTASIDVIPGDTAITTVVATGSAPLAFSEFGDDSALVSINSSTGVLTFDAPSVVGAYEVTVVATNAGGSDSQDVTINVESAADGNFFLLLGSLARARWRPVDVRWQASNIFEALAP